MNVDWRRLKAVVFQSDDWGLCAWCPDEEAYRALCDTPAFRSPAGRAYGRSTLESADDVRALAAVLEEVSGADGLPPVWQANTVMAAPDYARLEASGFAAGAPPALLQPEVPPRWQRPGLWDEVRRAEGRGLWRAELHGLLHVPASAWLEALRRGEPDARLALRHQCLVCEAAEAGSEFGPREPWELRARQLERGARHFAAFFGRPPTSFCPPDYGWDPRVEAAAARLGVGVLQGRAEQAGLPLGRLHQRWRAARWRRRAGPLFAMPARIAFEPRGEVDPGGRRGAHAALRRARAAWAAGRPAVVSSHRLNYAHLDAVRSAAGRVQLRALLGALAAEGAVFLCDAEVAGLEERGWSLRAAGVGRALLRCRGAARVPIRVVLPERARGAAARPVRGGATPAAAVEDGHLALAAEPGDYWVEWSFA